jgi:putative transposase
VIYIPNMTKNTEHRKNLHHYNTPGQAHELTFSCYRRLNYFDDITACEIFVQVLMEARQHFRFKIWAYVIMPNHIHLLIWPLEAKYDISKIDSGIKGITSKRYAKYLFENDAIKHGKFMVKRGSEQGFRFWQHGGGFDRNPFDYSSGQVCGMPRVFIMQ